MLTVHTLTVTHIHTLHMHMHNTQSKLTVLLRLIMRRLDQKVALEHTAN